LLVFNNVFAIWLQLIFIRHTKCETNPVKPDFLHCAAYFKKLFYTLDFILLSWRCCFMYPHLILEGGVWWQHLEIDSVARYLAGSWILPGVILFFGKYFLAWCIFLGSTVIELTGQAWMKPWIAATSRSLPKASASYYWSPAKRRSRKKRMMVILEMIYFYSRFV